MKNGHVAIFTGGDRPHPAIEHVVGGSGLLIAADGGFEHALAMNHFPDVLIGDMDSISPDHLARAESSGVEVIRHPVDKDKTDTELAIELAIEREMTFLTIVSGGGDRLDHILGFLHSVAPYADSEVHVTLMVGSAVIEIVPQGEWRTVIAGEEPVVSLIPLGGPARGVTTERLKWELSEDTLVPFSSRGLSNVPLDQTFNVYVAEGYLAVVQPYFFDRASYTPTEGGTR